jgi:AraC family transcriptional activator of pyochelin receptor
MNERLVLLSGELIVAAGVNRFDAPVRVKSDLRAGLKVVVLLSGRLYLRVGRRREQEICGPTGLIIRSSIQTPRDQIFTPDIPIRYALVQMAEGVFGSRLGHAMDELAAHAPSETSGDGVIVLSCPAGHVLRSLANQIMNCPIGGPERELYLCGKALELASLTVSNCMSNLQSDHAISLSSRDVENIKAARDVLIASLRNPPRLDVLAQQCGLNVRKLNTGFRKVFGTTVFGFLFEYRLETAYKLLTSSEMSVSEVAYHVGYGAAHFATVFRKRFGISPSELR